MSLGLSVVGSLLFLAPGLACVLAWYLDGPSLVRRPLSSSGSVGVLVAAPVVAASAHGVAILLFALNGAIAPHNPLNVLPFSIDPYPVFASLMGGKSFFTSKGWEFLLGWSFVYIFILSWVSVRVYKTYSWLQSRWIRTNYPDTRRPRESQLAFMLRQVDQSGGALVAVVRTRVPPYVGMVGWIGPVDGVRLAPHDELISLRLLNPSLVSVPDDWMERTEDRYFEHEPPFETRVLHIEAAEIMSVEYLYLPLIEATADITLDDFFGEAVAAVREMIDGDHE